MPGSRCEGASDADGFSCSPFYASSSRSLLANGRQWDGAEAGVTGVRDCGRKAALDCSRRK